MTDISYKEKQRKRKVVFPATEEDSEVHFPIHDKSHARNALSRVAQYSSVPGWAKKRGIGSLEALKDRVRSAVSKAYPGIEVTKEDVDMADQGNKVYTVDSNVDVVLDGERYQLEAGDKIRINPPVDQQPPVEPDPEPAPIDAPPPAEPPAQ